MLEVYFLERQTHWSWHAVFIDLILDLQKKYETKIFHRNDGNYLCVERFNNYNIPDCEILIYDTEKDILKAVTFSESRTGILDIFIERNNPNDILLITHRYDFFPLDFDPSKYYKFKVAGTVYYTFCPHINYNYYYSLRKFRGADNLIDKMFCLFTTNRHDPHPMREMGLVSQSPGLLSMQDYLSLAIKYKMGLAIHGRSEMCHRDIEYLGIGLPMIRLEYINNTLQPPLIPNYHYISVDRSKFPLDGNADRIGGPEYIEAYKNRFYEVKDDINFLNYISENAKNYFDQYCNFPNNVKHLLQLLNIE